MKEHEELLLGADVVGHERPLPVLDAVAVELATNPVDGPLLGELDPDVGLTGVGEPVHDERQHVRRVDPRERVVAPWRRTDELVAQGDGGRAVVAELATELDVDHRHALDDRLRVLRRVAVDGHRQVRNRVVNRQPDLGVVVETRPARHRGSGRGWCS